MTAPVLNRPTVPEVLALVREYYALPDNGAGGNLHIVLDDGNLHRPDIRYCRERAVEAGDWRGVILCDMLLQLTMSQMRWLVKQSYG